LTRILRISSRNFVTVRRFVANCWRRVAMHDYSVLGGPDWPGATSNGRRRRF